MARGAKARFGDAASVIIRVRVTPDQRRELRHVARENRTSMAGVIRDAVDEYVADYKDVGVFRGPRMKVAS